MNIALMITITIAIAGYFATYLNNAIVEKRKQRLDLINKQINNFYGPLFMAVEVGQASVRAFFLAVRGIEINIEEYLPLKDPFTADEEAEYRVWIEKVFMPLNEWCEKILRENAYLIIEKKTPQCILDFVTHVASYRAIISKWKDKPDSETYSVIPYPHELYKYAHKSYYSLKEKQLRLIGKI